MLWAEAQNSCYLITCYYHTHAQNTIIRISCKVLQCIVFVCTTGQLSKPPAKYVRSTDNIDRRSRLWEDQVKISVLTNQLRPTQLICQD